MQRHKYSKDTSKNYIIYGKHAVTAALGNKERKILEIFCTLQNIEYVKTYSGNHKVTLVDGEKLKTIVPEYAPHQGIAALVNPIAKYHISNELLSDQNSKIVILDQVTDPQNLGAILRSAAAFNISALIYPKDSSVRESGIVAKAACGALDLIPLIEVVNISNTIAELKKHGFWVLGLDGSAKQDIRDGKILEGKVAVVMGSERSGIRPLVAKNCDLLIKIPISTQMESLNVSNAAAVVFYEIYKNNHKYNKEN